MKELAADVCILDQTFEWTSPLNKLTLDNFVDWVIIFESLVIDLNMIGLLVLYRFNKLPSFAFVIVELLAQLGKNIIQNQLMTLGRLPGFNFQFPGFYSTLASYHDILDFYYSGHMATAVVSIYALLSLKRQHPDVRMFGWMFNFQVFFNLPYIWLHMTALRTHYSIDLAGGFAAGVVCISLGEKLSWYVDVGIFGSKTQNRGLFYYQPCPSCGWAVEKGQSLIDAEEALAQATVSGRSVYKRIPLKTEAKED
mgnify:CR=1 FL=1